MEQVSGLPIRYLNLQGAPNASAPNEEQQADLEQKISPPFTCRFSIEWSCFDRTQVLFFHFAERLDRHSRAAGVGTKHWNACQTFLLSALYELIHSEKRQLATDQFRTALKQLEAACQPDENRELKDFIGELHSLLKGPKELIELTPAFSVKEFKKRDLLFLARTLCYAQEKLKQASVFFDRQDEPVLSKEYQQLKTSIDSLAEPLRLLNDLLVVCKETPHKVKDKYKTFGPLLVTMNKLKVEAFAHLSALQKKGELLATDLSKVKSVNRLKTFCTYLQAHLDLLAPLDFFDEGCLVSLDAERLQMDKQRWLKIVIKESPWLLSKGNHYALFQLELVIREWWHQLASALEKQGRALNEDFYDCYSSTRLSQLCSQGDSFFSRASDEVIPSLVKSLQESHDAYAKQLQAAHEQHPSLAYLKVAEGNLKIWGQLIVDMDREFFSGMLKKTQPAEAAFGAEDIVLLERILRSMRFDLTLALPSLINDLRVKVSELEVAFQCENNLWRNHIDPCVSRVVVMRHAFDELLTTLQKFHEGSVSRAELEDLPKRFALLKSDITSFFDKQFRSAFEALMSFFEKEKRPSAVLEVRNFILKKQTFFLIYDEFISAYADIKNEDWKRLTETYVSEKKKAVTGKPNELFKKAQYEFGMDWNAFNKAQVVWAYLQTSFEAFIKEKQLAGSAFAEKIQVSLDHLLFSFLEGQQSGEIDLSKNVVVVVKGINDALQESVLQTEHLFLKELACFINFTLQDPEFILTYQMSCGSSHLTDRDLRLLTLFIDQACRSQKTLVDDIKQAEALSIDAHQSGSLKSMRTSCEKMMLPLRLIKTGLMDLVGMEDNQKRIHLIGKNIVQALQSLDDMPAIGSQLRKRKESFPGALEYNKAVSKISDRVAYLTASVLPISKLCQSDLLHSFGKGDKVENLVRLDNLISNELQGSWFSATKHAFIDLTLKNWLRKKSEPFFTHHDSGNKVLSDLVLLAERNQTFRQYVEGYTLLNKVLFDLQFLGAASQPIQKETFDALRSKAAQAYKGIAKLIPNTERDKQDDLIMSLLEDLTISSDHFLLPALLLETTAEESRRFTNRDVQMITDVLDNIDFTLQKWIPELQKMLRDKREAIPSSVRSPITQGISDFFAPLSKISLEAQPWIKELRHSMTQLLSGRVEVEIIQLLSFYFAELQKKLQEIAHFYHVKHVKSLSESIVKVIDEKNESEMIHLHTYWNGILAAEISWLGVFANENRWKKLLESIPKAPSALMSSEGTEAHLPKKKKKQRSPHSKSPAEAKAPPQVVIKDGKQEELSNSNSIAPPTEKSITTINLSAASQMRLPEKPKKNEIALLCEQIEEAISGSPIQGERQRNKREDQRKLSIETLLRNHLPLLQDARKRRREVLEMSSCAPYCFTGLKEAGYSVEMLLEAVMWTHPMFDSEEAKHDCKAKVGGKHDFKLAVDAIKEYSLKRWKNAYALLGSQADAEALIRLGKIHTFQRYKEKYRSDPANAELVSYFDEAEGVLLDMLQVQEMKERNQLGGDAEGSGSWSHQTGSKIIDEKELQRRSERLLEKTDNYYSILFKSISALLQHGFRAF